MNHMTGRFTALLFTLALCLLLTGCGEKPQAAAPIDCAALGEAILGAQDFSPDVETMSRTRLLALLEMEEAQLDDAFMALDASRASAECVIVVTAGSGKEGEVKALLEAYRDSLLAQYRDYQPGEVPKLEASKVIVRGAQCVLAVAPDQQAAVSACEAKWNE